MDTKYHCVYIYYYIRNIIMYTFIIIRMDTKYVYIYYYTHVYIRKVDCFGRLLLRNRGYKRIDNLHLIEMNVRKDF